MPQVPFAPLPGSPVTPIGKPVSPTHSWTLKPAAELAIQEKLEHLGGVAVLGAPTHKEDTIWRFAGGSCICYNEEQKQAFEVHGAIYARWVALGREKSYLGYPTTDEIDFPAHGRVNGFQNGDVYWWSDTGAIDLRDVVVTYTGLYCFGETDWDQGSTEDEPYFILSVTTPETSGTLRTRIYDNVNNGEARPDQIELYRGRPYGINVSAVLMEYDFGDPDRYKDEVKEVVMGVHLAGTAALALIPGVGPVLAGIAGPALGKLMPTIGGAISDAFGWGDDRIGGWSTTIPAREMVLYAARNSENSFQGIVYELQSDVISGSGASYKAYFTFAPVTD